MASALLATSCGGDAIEDDGVEAADAGPVMSLADRLAEGGTLFGVFSGPMTPEQGAAIVGERSADFVLYSMESGPFDLATMNAYMAGMRVGATEHGVSPHPVLLRVPSLHADPDGAAPRVSEALGTAIAGIVFPHVTTAQEAAESVTLMGAPWPLGDSGLDVLIVEDREGVSNVREIMATPGLSVVFAGPGDLGRAYDGDMEAVENAIQAVLSACLDFEVACGVTAGADDIVTRLDQGFRVIIVTETNALQVGRAHLRR
jgi:2-keto-3-deoxy-L-rhamnonate aldolase RhmA